LILILGRPATQKPKLLFSAPSRRHLDRRFRPSGLAPGRGPAAQMMAGQLALEVRGREPASEVPSPHNRRCETRIIGCKLQVVRVRPGPRPGVGHPRATAEAALTARGAGISLVCRARAALPPAPAGPRLRAQIDNLKLRGVRASASAPRHCHCPRATPAARTPAVMGQSRSLRRP
jgi:hypothetical protein